jgi:transcriptional regulator with XRE-family HTH domain
MSEVDKAIGLRLRIARKTAGFKTALDFAKQQQLAKSTYSQHENGKRALTAEQIIHYAQQLEVEASWLLTGSGHPCPRGENKAQRIAAMNKEIDGHLAPCFLTHIKNIPIELKDNSAMVNMELLAKIMVSTLKALIPRGLNINAEELMVFCVDVYNNLEFLLTGDEEKDKMVKLSIHSLLCANKIYPKMPKP